MLKASEGDEVKQHADSLTLRVFDLTSCGLIGVSDASLGGARCYPREQDSKTVKVY